MSDDDIISKIEYYLSYENIEKYNEKLELGLDFSSNYTQEKYADRLYKIISNNIN